MTHENESPGSARAQRPASVSERLRHNKAAAESIGADPGAVLPVDEDELLAVASDLVAWGAYDPARKVIRVLREKTDRFSRELEEFDRRMSTELLGNQFLDEHFLSHALDVLDDRNASAPRLLVAAHTLLTWGALSEAEGALERLNRAPGFRSAVIGMRAAIDQLRASGIVDKTEALDEGGPDVGFNAPREAMVVKGSGPPDTAIVAFTGFARNFWVSLQVFHRLLSDYAGHMIYLTDHSSKVFLDGLPSIAPSYREMLGFLRKELATLGVRRTHVIASSSGGFVGLRAAADLPASGFLGFSIGSDLTGRLPITTYDASARERCGDRGMLIDLAPYMQKRFMPTRAIVCAPRYREMERLHAENLAAIPRFDVRLIDDDEHDSVKSLIQRGELKPLFDEFFVARHGKARNG